MLLIARITASTMQYILWPSAADSRNANYGTRTLIFLVRNIYRCRLRLLRQLIFAVQC